MKDKCELIKKSVFSAESECLQNGFVIDPAYVPLRRIDPRPLRQVETAQEEARRRGLPVLTPWKCLECDSQGSLIQRSRSGRILKPRQLGEETAILVNSSSEEDE